MKVTELRPSLLDRVQFRFSESIRVPETSGCYALSSIFNDVIYIGKSVNLCRRMQQHLEDSRMTKLTSHGLATWFNYGILSPAEINRIEIQLLFAFKALEGQLPPLNRVGP